MKINDKDIKTYFHADVCSFHDKTMEIENETFLPIGSYLPIVHATTISPQVRELVLDFTSREDMSMFAVELMNPCTIDVDDGYIYDCILNGKSESQDGVNSYTATYSFQVLKHKALIEVEDSNFMVQGNIACGCIYELHALDALQRVEVDGMIISNMKKDQTLIIDGIDKLVYDITTPELSSFDQVQIQKFPKLIPGIHTIQKDSELCRVVIKYYPVFM